MNRPSAFMDGSELAAFASSALELMLTRAVIADVESAASASRIEPAMARGASAMAIFPPVDSFTPTLPHIQESGTKGLDTRETLTVQSCFLQEGSPYSNLCDYSRSTSLIPLPGS